MASMTHGALTDEIADELRRLTRGRPTWCVYHNHDGERRERLWAHMGAEPHAWANLSGVDILLGDAENGKAILVLEIQETACSPKKLLGDVCALALCEFVTAGCDDRHDAVTPETELWVCFPANPRGHQLERDEQALERLQEAWGGTLPVRVRLVVSDRRDSLRVAVFRALREWAGGA